MKTKKKLTDFVFFSPRQYKATDFKIINNYIKISVAQ